MSAGKFSHSLLDPTSAPVIEAFHLAGRPTSLDGKVLGIFVNSKPNSVRLMELIKEKLQKEYAVKNVIWQEGEHICRPSPISLIDETASQVDAVITGTGD